MFIDQYYDSRQVIAIKSDTIDFNRYFKGKIWECLHDCNPLRILANSLRQIKYLTYTVICFNIHMYIHCGNVFCIIATGLSHKSFDGQ